MMMMTMRHLGTIPNAKSRYLAVMISIAAVAGCDDALLDSQPTDSLTGAIFWQSGNDAVNAVNALYAFLPGIDEMRWDMVSDIGHTNEIFAGGPVAIERGEHNAELGLFSEWWDSHYDGIRAANYFLENVGRVSEQDVTFTEELEDRLRAEARFIRALLYTRLVMFFGDVPLVTNTLDLQASKEVTRAPADDVWDFVNDELAEIEARLPEQYTGGDLGRITRGAAAALRARAMLYAGRWQDAAAAARAVMDIGVYSLYPSYRELFGYGAQNNTEVILDRQYSQGVASHDFFATYGPQGMNGDVGISPTRTLVDSYETVNGMAIDEDPAYDVLNPYANRDPRLGYTLFIPAFSDDVPGDIMFNGHGYDPRPGSGTADEVELDFNRTKTGFNTKKYVNEEDLLDRNNGGTNFILIRYADVLLMYAEAKIELGEIDASVYDAINQVRQRPDVGLPAISAGRSQAELRDIVRHERMVELAMEGLRFFDLRRWRLAHEVMIGPIPGMRYIRSGGAEVSTLAYGGVVRSFNADRDYLWPLPQQELVLNPNLTQNPGY